MQARGGVKHRCAGAPGKRALSGRDLCQAPFDGGGDGVVVLMVMAVMVMMVMEVVVMVM